MTNFAGVRLIAAAMVVVGHSFVLTGAVPPSLLGTPVHVLAVRVFFVISGYLVCGSWLRDPAMHRFLLRRALRIMPGLVAVVLGGVLVGAAMTTLPVGAFMAHPQTVEYLWNLVLSPRFALPGVFDDGRAFTAVNGSLWSLPVEVAMYLLLPLYAGRWRVAALVVPAVTAAVVFTVVWPGQIAPVLFATSIPFGLRFAADFVVGAGVRVWRLERRLSLQVALLGLAVAQAGAVSAVGGAVLSGVALPYAVLAFCLAGRPVFGRLEGRADLSYGVYLWAGPVQQGVLSLVGAGVGWGGLTVLAGPVILGMAAVSWYGVERSALRWKPGSRDVTGLQNRTASSR